MKISHFIGLSALIVCFGGIASAEMYRWTDAEGNVIYSQTKPTDGSDVTVISPESTSPKTPDDEAAQQLNEQIEALNQRSEARLKAKQEAEKKKQEDQAKRQRCETARKNLETMQSRPPNTLYNIGNNEYKRFTAEEFEAKIEQLQKDIDEFCR